MAPVSRAGGGAAPSPAAAASGVREALRTALASSGYPVATDTVSLRRELYVRGEGDRAAAIFEFKATAPEAAETMYQGRWTSDLPPRFAVLPSSQVGAPDVDFLEQAGLSVLFFVEDVAGVTFVEWERVIERIGPPSPGVR